MIRLTCILVAGIGITLSVAGRDLDGPQGSDVSVARADTSILTSPGVLALDDEAGAIAKAIAATDAWEPITAAHASEATALTEPATMSEANGANLDLAVVNAGRVNLRSGPGTTNAVIEQVVRGQQVEIIGPAGNGWSRIKVLDTGLTAYIFDRFLTAEG